MINEIKNILFFAHYCIKWEL